MSSYIEDPDGKIAHQVNQLLQRLNQGFKIDGRIIFNLKCCSRIFDVKVVATDGHIPTCLWNYYVLCPHCINQISLAKILPITFRCICH